jgi:heptosyltransferase-2
MPTWPKAPPKNIIIRIPNWIGDVVMATPVIADLRQSFKEATITVMCQTNVCPLIKHDPNIDEIFCFKRPSGWIHRGRQHFDIIDPLRRGEYDLGILLTNSLSSAWWFWRGDVKNRLGYKRNFRNWLLNKALSFPLTIHHQHLVITYKMLLEPLEIPVSKTSPKLYISKNEMDSAKELLNRYGIKVGQNSIIGINPGAAYGSAKCWLPERFREVTQRLLLDKNAFVLYFGDSPTSNLIKKICENLPERVINLAGKTSLRELMALISCCSAFLTNDSGPMHIAAALDIPLLALFGSTSEITTGPYLKGKIIHKHVECSPCYKRICPIDFRCMKKIEVEEVYNELQKVLENGKTRGV